jgi:organic radical activating enzyme
VERLWSIVQVELTSHCNFSCSFCRSDAMSRKKTFMPRALWEKVLLELGGKNMTPTVFFHVMGEPLLHRDIFDAIRFANGAGLSVSLYTNGALLDGERSGKLLGALQKGGIVVSMQDISPESFEARCRGFLSWEAYLGRLRAFVARVEKEKARVAVQIHCMVDMRSMGWDLQRIRREQKKIQAIYDNWVKVLGCRRHGPINILNPAATYPLGDRSSFFVKHAGTWDNRLIGPDMDVIPRHAGQCDLITDTFAVLSNGICTYCCGDYEGELNLGNANQDSLEEIYFGKKATAIREAGRKGRLIVKRCTICRGALVHRRTGKPVSRNLFSDYYIFREHLERYGLRSAVGKVREAARRRCWTP